MITKYNIFEGFIFKESIDRKKYSDFRTIFDKLVEDLHEIFKDFDTSLFTSIDKYQKNKNVYSFEIGIGNRNTITILSDFLLSKKYYGYYIQDIFYMSNVYGYTEKYRLTLEELYTKISELKDKYTNKLELSKLIDRLIAENKIKKVFKDILFTHETYDFTVDYLLTKDNKYIDLIDLDKCSQNIIGKWEYLKNANSFDIL